MRREPVMLYAARMDHFQPHSAPRLCRYCHYLIEQEPQSCTALCGHGGTIMRQARPHLGCAFWEREPGSDDDLEPKATAPSC